MLKIIYPQSHLSFHRSNHRLYMRFFAYVSRTADPEWCTDENAVRRFPPPQLTEGWTEGRGVKLWYLRMMNCSSLSPLLSSPSSHPFKTFPAGQSLIHSLIPSFIHSCVYTHFSHSFNLCLYSIYHSLYIFRQDVNPFHRFTAIVPPFPQCHLNLLYDFQCRVYLLRLPRWSL